MLFPTCYMNHHRLNPPQAAHAHYSTLLLSEPPSKTRSRPPRFARTGLPNNLQTQLHNALWVESTRTIASPVASTENNVQVRSAYPLATLSQLNETNPVPDEADPLFGSPCPLHLIATKNTSYAHQAPWNLEIPEREKNVC